MDVDGLTKERWSEILGKLPEGFSIIVETGELKLLYRNRKERQIIPTEVCHQYVVNVGIDSPDECDVVRYLKKTMENFQREKLAPKKTKQEPKPKKVLKKKIAKKSKSPRK